MNIILFIEEYSKETKGVLNVVKISACELSRTNNITIITNNEHWGFKELSEYFGSFENVTVIKLNFRNYYGKYHSKIENNYKHLKLLCINALDLVCMPYYILSLVNFFKPLRINSIIIHNGGWPGGFLCRIATVASKISKVKNILFVIHSYPYISKSKYFKNIIKGLSFLQGLIVRKSATSVITVSDSAAYELNKIFDMKLRVIPNGIENLPRKAEHINFGQNNKKFRLVFIGKVCYSKGTHVLVNALKNVKFACEIMIVGPIVDTNYFNLIKSIEIPSNCNIRFLGFVENVDYIISNSDIVIVPAVEQESFGLVVLEAMRQSKAVICSDFGGMKEIVVNNLSGLIVKNNSSDDLYVAINYLYENPEICKLMGINGYNLFINKFISNVMVNNYLKLLKE